MNHCSVNVEKALKRAREVLDIENDALCHIKQNLDGGFCGAIGLILDQIRSGHKVVVTGMGKSFHIGQKIAATLTSTGTPSVPLHPSEAMHGDLGIISPGDAVLVISYSGESEEVINLLPAVKRMGNPIIAMTADPASTLARNSEVVISISVPREACPFNLAPTASTTATLAIGDAMAMVLLDAQGFRKEDYGRFHPAGAIGRSLLLKISDVMRAGDRIASVGPNALVQEAVLAMTRAKSGAVAVVDEDRKILGIFTDGDLRRHIEDLESLVKQKISDVMTENPVQVQKDSLAAEILSIYESRQIDDILVVDSEGRLAGLVDIQDLPKFKIL